MAYFILRRRFNPHCGFFVSPIKDIWGNDLLNAAYKKPEKTKDSISIEKMPFISDSDNPVKAQTLPRTNNLLPNSKDYDIMYPGETTNYSNPASSGQANQNASKSGISSNTHVTYGHSDKNVVGGIQLRLNELGYTEVDITGPFDAKTEAGIKKFQEKRGLPVTGVLDDETKKAMGFSDDYSVSRKGANATPWHAPESRPFNLEAYNRKQEELKREEEAAKKTKEEEENFSFWAHLLNFPLSVLSIILGEDAVSGMNPGTEVAEDPLQEEELWQSGTMNDYNN